MIIINCLNVFVLPNMFDCEEYSQGWSAYLIMGAIYLASLDFHYDYRVRQSMKTFLLGAGGARDVD